MAVVARGIGGAIGRGGDRHNSTVNKNFTRPRPWRAKPTQKASGYKQGSKEQLASLTLKSRFIRARERVEKKSKLPFMSKGIKGGNRDAAWRRKVELSGDVC